MNMQINIIVSKAPLGALSVEFGPQVVINDGDLFNMLNGGVTIHDHFITLHQDELIGGLEKKLLELNAERIVIHTFNPMVINALEPHKNDHVRLNKRFFLYNDREEFVDLLCIESFSKKLEVLSLGEAVVDSYMRTLSASDTEES